MKGARKSTGGVGDNSLKLSKKSALRGETGAGWQEVG